jgi:hypothetical protein
VRNNRDMKRGVALAVLVLTTAACGSASQPAAFRLTPVPLAKRSVVCGAARPWTSKGRLVHAQQVGHLVWLDVPSFKAGRPTKVRIEPFSGARRNRIRLFGTRCADGTPLRFGFFISKGTRDGMTERLAAKSGLAAGGAGYLPLYPARMQRLDWPESGYVTLTRGRWIVQARVAAGGNRSRLLGSTVFDVP